MENKITEISINQLFNEESYSIKFKDNRLIIVAENGTGKTTIVNIIYYFLSRQWSRLQDFEFESIKIIIDKNEVKISKEELSFLLSKKLNHYLSRRPARLKAQIELLLKEVDIYRLSRYNLSTFAEAYGIPTTTLINLTAYLKEAQIDLFESNLQEKNDKLGNLFKSQILYLPTYRRIEQDLDTIFPYLDKKLHEYKEKREYLNQIKRSPAFIELVEFGMEDVEQKVNSNLSSLKEFLNFQLKNVLTGKYLRDIINENYKEINYETFKATKVDITNLLSRIDDSVLSKTEKSELGNFVKKINEASIIEKNENKIIAHFIYILSQIYKELQQKEKDIVKFVEICNSYLVNKLLKYDNINYTIKIYPIKDNNIQFNKELFYKDLSSGEKQIVSLFSHLTLSTQKSFFVIIDEPELSLSVPWQKKFLVDISEHDFCSGILAVTHSPFVFANDLEQNTKGLNEFLISQ